MRTQRCRLPKTAKAQIRMFSARVARRKELPMPEPLRLRLYENYRFVLYAPFYAAHATSAYAAEGLEVELLPSPGPGKAEAALTVGEIDVLWMGPIRVMK